MCGRYTIAAGAEALQAEFGIEPPSGFAPRFNVAPGQDVPVIGHGSDGTNRFSLLRWGLVPSRAVSMRETRPRINARAESLLRRPSFRESFLDRRCLVVADGFYEWEDAGGVKRPWRFRLQDERPFAFAGLWDAWADGHESLYSCAIITTRANAIVAPVHDRMPVILDRNGRHAWLDPDLGADALQPLLVPMDPDAMNGYVVSPAVNSAANDSPDCITPV